MSVFNEGFDHETDKDMPNFILDDLQLAAELGKTLLERNKELESTLKRQQELNEDQRLEIEYLTKQTTALREVNDSRLRVYEQLEVSISDLERAKHRLEVDYAAEKKQNKKQCHYNEQLESRNEELTKQLDEVNKLLEAERRQYERLSRQTASLSADQVDSPSPKALSGAQTKHTSLASPTASSLAVTDITNGMVSFSCSTSSKTASPNTSMTANGDEFSGVNDDLMRIMADMEATKRCLMAEQQRVAELEEQLYSQIQENRSLHKRIAETTTNEEMKSVHDELSVLEEVRQGTMCNRCMRIVDERGCDEASSIAATEDSDRSLMDLINESTVAPQKIYRSAVTIKLQDHAKSDGLDLPAAPSPNPYRQLVEKYEALLEVQRHPFQRSRQPAGGQTAGYHQEDAQTSGEFSSINTQKDDEESLTKMLKNGGRRKLCLQTPTDFSETETTSSGFSDETSNKATQTEGGKELFLWTMANGEHCKISIGDDANLIESRFRQQPEYRQLFNEIFAILKKAAANKDEGEKLPLLDEKQTVEEAAAPEEAPTSVEYIAQDFTDETLSVVSSVASEQSVAMSERITKQEREDTYGGKKLHIVDKTGGQENKPPAMESITYEGRVLTQLKRQPLDYMALSMGVRKKNKKKNKNVERSDSPILSSSPRVVYSCGKKRRDVRPFNPSALATPSVAVSANEGNWRGQSMTVYNRKLQMESPVPPRTPKNGDGSGVMFKQSAASQDLHKLKKLDLSYAEVVRRADGKHRRK